MPYDKDADVYKPDSRGKPPTGLAGTVAEALFAECKKIWRTAADLRKVFDVVLDGCGVEIYRSVRSVGSKLGAAHQMAEETETWQSSTYQRGGRHI